MKVYGANKLSAWSIAATQIWNGFEPVMGAPPLYSQETLYLALLQHVHTRLFSQLTYLLH